MFPPGQDGTRGVQGTDNPHGHASCKGAADGGFRMGTVASMFDRVTPIVTSVERPSRCAGGYVLRSRDEEETPAPRQGGVPESHADSAPIKLRVKPDRRQRHEPVPAHLERRRVNRGADEKTEGAD